MPPVTSRYIPRVAAALLLFATSHILGAQAPPTRGCTAPEHRQFDFWVGEWRVFNPAGRPAGTNRITSVLDGCALLEEWTGAGGSTGKSLNFYDRAARAWTQTWIDNTGQPLRIKGGLRDGRMVMEAEHSDSSGRVTVERITWTPIARDTVRQHWERSTDGRKTWVASFDGRYVRVR
jgi:hypothetical protein